ncbi:MAG: DHA2 family efflux MFS transporter permease subunit, partial [Gammaproteobacteria bacterium]
MTFSDLFERYGSSYRWLATTTMLFGLVALGMSITIVDVATPYIEGAFGMSVSQEQWLSTGFLAATTISIMVAPWMANRFGNRGTYLGTLILFLVASIAGGISSSSFVIILSRVGLGAATGLIRPVAMEVLIVAFGQRRKGVAMAIYGMSLGLPLTLASVLGGWLVETLHWRAVFYAPIPFCLISLVLAWLYLPNARSKNAGRFDWLGLVLLSIAIFALLTALANWYRWGPHSTDILLSLLLTGVSTISFIVWELRCPAPLIELRIFLQPVFASAAVAVFLFGGVFYGIVFLLPLFVEAVQGYSPLEAGLLFLPSTLVLAILVPIVGPLSDRYSPVLFAVPATLIACVGIWMMAHAGLNTSFSTLALAMALVAVGMAGFPPPILATSIGSLPRHLVHYGAGVINFALQLGGALITS